MLSYLYTRRCFCRGCSIRDIFELGLGTTLFIREQTLWMHPTQKKKVPFHVIFIIFNFRNPVLILLLMPRHWSDICPKKGWVSNIVFGG